MTIKNSAQYQEYLIIQNADNSIEIKVRDGKNREKLRTFADALGIKYDDDPNTHVLGRRVIEAIKKSEK